MRARVKGGVPKHGDPGALTERIVRQGDDRVVSQIDRDKAAAVCPKCVYEYRAKQHMVRIGRMKPTEVGDAPQPIPAKAMVMGKCRYHYELATRRRWKETGEYIQRLMRCARATNDADMRDYAAYLGQQLRRERSFGVFMDQGEPNELVRWLRSPVDPRAKLGGDAHLRLLEWEAENE